VSRREFERKLRYMMKTRRATLRALDKSYKRTSHEQDLGRIQKQRDKKPPK
jgi:hypothetical protein